MTGDHLLRVFGDTVARAGATTYAGPAYRALLPYAGLLNVGGGHSAGLPVDDVLGRLAALDGDVPAAVRHARDAVALARSMPSPPLLVHCLDHLADAVERAGEDDADVLRRPRPTRSRPPRASCGPSRAPRLDASRPRRGEIGRHASRRAAVGAHHTVGQRPAARQQRPRAARPAADDAGRGGVRGRARRATRTRRSPPISVPRLDAQAKRAYRRRLLELQAEVDDAEAANDPVRGERAHVEMDALLRELKRAVGLGGRDRPTGSDAERARVNVVRSLRRAIAAVADQAPLLGAHLEESVRTGGHCIYLPEPARRAVVDGGDRRARRPRAERRVADPDGTNCSIRLNAYQGVGIRPGNQFGEHAGRREPCRRGDG